MNLRAHIENIKYSLGLSERYCTQELYNKFNEYNKKYFNNELPSLPIYVDNTISPVNGKFISDINIENKMIVPKSILINKSNLINEQDLLDTFIHEMVHYFECIKYQPTKELWNKALEIYNDHQDHVCGWQMDKIIDILMPFNGRKHSPKFKEICHTLNFKYPELNLRTCFEGHRL